MSDENIYQCQCPHCQQETDHTDKKLHHKMNLFLSRLDEQQRRWYVAIEAKRLGHGGIRQLSIITGLDEKTIHRGIEKMDEDLSNQILDRVRLPGGGRKPIEKKRTRN